MRGSNRFTGGRALALLVAMACLFAACGGSDDEDDGATPTTEADAAPGGDADPDGRIRLGYDLTGGARGVFTLDPAEVPTNTTDQGLFYLMYSLLLRPDATGELVPDLAEEATIIDGGTIEVVLREGLTFSDGSPLDAEAVKVSLDRNLAAGNEAAFGSGYQNLQEVAVVDETTVRLLIANDAAPSWYDTYLGSWESSVVKPNPADPTRPIGGGPMVLSDLERGTSALLTKNPSYWDVESIRFAELELVQVSGTEARAGVNALAAGQLDMTPADASLLDAIGSGNDILVTPDPAALVNMGVCKSEPPYDDPAVRKAVNKAIDREALSDAVFDGLFQPALGLWPEGHRFHDPAVEDAVSYDPAAAEELLAEAGYEDGVTIDVYVVQGANLPTVAEVLQQQLAAVGIELRINSPQNYVGDFLQAKKPGMGLVPIMPPKRLKLGQWTGTNIGNTCQFNDPELDELAGRLSTLSDASDEAVEVWHAIEKKVVAEDTLSVFLLFGSASTAYDPRVVGDAAILPYPVIPVPDPRVAYVKRG